MDPPGTESLELPTIAEAPMPALETPLLVSPPPSSISLPGTEPSSTSPVVPGMTLLPLSSTIAPMLADSPATKASATSGAASQSAGASVSLSSIPSLTLPTTIPIALPPTSSSNSKESTAPVLVAPPKAFPADSVAGMPPIPAGMQSIQIPSLQGLQSIPLGAPKETVKAKTEPSAAGPKTATGGGGEKGQGGKGQANDSAKTNFSPVFLLQRMSIPVQGANQPLQIPTVMEGVQYTWASSSGLPAPFIVIPKSDAKVGEQSGASTTSVKSEPRNGETKTRRGKAALDCRPFACQQCGKRFNHKYNLKRHYLIHTGEKPYACEHCQKRFNQKSNLIQHIRTHTGEKPYKCDKCEKRFAQRSTFSQHQRIHSRGSKRKNI